MSGPLERALDDAQAAVHARMRAAITAPEAALAPLYAWLSYQLGWSALDGAPSDQRTAKGTRSRVCLTACTAVGGPPRAAVDGAAAVELVHEFSLIHDDIEDGDAVRRGRPALWVAVGLPQALNAGDALFAIARRTLTAPAAPGDDAARRVDAARRLDDACVRLAEGQYLDLAFEARDDVSPAAYEAMVARKTGALLGAAAAIGAVLGGADGGTADALDAWGRRVGTAFQLADDVLGLWGDPSATGKPAGSDLRRGKRSLPLLTAMSDPMLGAAIAPVLGAGDDASEADVAAALARLERAGIRARCVARAAALAEGARAALDGLDLAAEPRAALDTLARRAVDRTH